MFSEFIAAHLVGDYLLQNDFLATEKKNSSIVCMIHVLLYVLMLSLVF